MATIRAVPEVSSFQIDIAESELADLHERLTRARLPRAVPGSWDLGTPPAYLDELLAYWRSDYNWRQAEANLNTLPQFVVDLEGVNVHFAHVRGSGQNPFPLLLTHGWPGTFAEFATIAPLLADPASSGGQAADAFDLVIPSLPGFAFSSVPEQRPRFYTSRLWAALMANLGYDRYGLHAGDLGAGVSIALAHLHPERVAGLHLTAAPGDLRYWTGSRSAEEEAYLSRSAEWDVTEGAYSSLQSTKPASLAAGLSDSPAGLASWIVEKYRAWSDNDGNVEQRFSKDHLLTTVSLYWFTNTALSSFLPYADFARRDPQTDITDRISTPTGVVKMPGDLPGVAPRSSLERAYNLVRYTEFPEGGHFAATEVPQLLAEELRTFFRPYRTHGAGKRAQPGAAHNGPRKLSGIPAPVTSGDSSA